VVEIVWPTQAHPLHQDPESSRITIKRVPDTLFVYGSLRSECDNPYARLLRERAESLGKATVRGSIFRIGEYPGYRTEPDGVVNGELWDLRDAVAILAAMDDYEGPEYSRVVISLFSSASSRTSAWIYLYTGSVRMDQRIPSGDFLAR
jgi:gamma-glutamylcyclotransferase (GGCT)/AIG2-like uncharacterized protein YtfP